MFKVLLVISLIIVASCSGVTAENNRTFPDGFLIGVSSSAYQTEGAWNEDEKGENIWDHWIHADPSRIKNNDTADDSADSYHQFIDDLNLVANMNVTHFRLSIPWSRILPHGVHSPENTKAIKHYQELINKIISYKIIPVVTLYYNDLPQPLQDLGGWTNPELVHYFVVYARVLFQNFGQVPYWITFNDPKAICGLGYGEGVYAPGIALDGTGNYLCSYVLLKAHAAVYHLYKEEFPYLKGRISIAINMEWSEPATNSSTDVEAAERRNLFEFGTYAHPIFIGNWPQLVINRIGSRSKSENFKRSRLPELTPEEIVYIKGTADFIAINTYSTRLVSDIPEPEYDDPGYMKDMRVEVTLDPKWSKGTDGNAIVPWGVRNALNWLKVVYNDSEIFITENGVAVDSWNDDIRIKFYTDYLLAILDAIYEDNVKVIGFTARSLLDGFEWTAGYSQHFGIYQVDNSNPKKLRSAKKSFVFFERLASTLRIPDDDINPITTTVATTTKGAANRMSLFPSLVLFITFMYFLLV